MFGKVSDPADIMRRGVKPEDIGMNQTEYEKRVAEAMKPWKVQKTNGTMNVRSSARAQQIMSKGAADKARDDALTKKTQTMNRVFWLRLGVVGGSILGTIFLCTQFLFPSYNMHYQKGLKRKQLISRAEADAAAKAATSSRSPPSQDTYSTKAVTCLFARDKLALLDS